MTIDLKKFLRRPMKAPSEIVPFSQYRHWPKFGSIKMDGFRNTTLCGIESITPALKPQANLILPRHFHAFFTFLNKHRLIADGELWSPNMSFNELSSRVRSTEGDLAGVEFHVFDLLTEGEWCGEEGCSYLMRYQRLMTVIEDHNFPFVRYVRQHSIQNAVDAETFFQQMLDAGHEGIMLRSPHSSYKNGRCTIREEDLLKAKGFVTDDAMILGVTEMETLVDGAEERHAVDGRLERSHRAEDYTPSGHLGAFLVTMDNGKTSFKISPGKGVTREQRRHWWLNRHTFLGQWVEFEHLPHGAKTSPRHGRLVRFRDAKS